MTTEKHLVGMENEQKVVKLLNSWLGISVQNLISRTCSDSESREKASAFCNPVIFNDKAQYAGTDIQYNGLSIDVKCNGTGYTRACFELFKDESNCYSYRNSPETHLIAHYMERTKKLYLFPSKFIELVVNRENVAQLELAADFYCNNKKIYSGENRQKPDKFNFYIDPDELTIPLRNYLAFFCSNKDVVKMFLQTYQPYENENFKE